MGFFHNAMQKKTQPINRDYVRRPATIGQAMRNIGSVERMMPQIKTQAASGSATKPKPRKY